MEHGAPPPMNSQSENKRSENNDNKLQKQEENSGTVS